jgi:site-specific DNA-methyltransferase (adenine-specific)
LNHGAATPLDLCAWWVRYICPDPGVVLDCFNGSGTVGLAATRLGREYIGIEKEERYCEISRKRIMNDAPLFYGT